MSFLRVIVALLILSVTAQTDAGDVRPRGDSETVSCTDTSLRSESDQEPVHSRSKLNVGSESSQASAPGAASRTADTESGRAEAQPRPSLNKSAPEPTKRSTGYSSYRSAAPCNSDYYRDSEHRQGYFVERGVDQTPYAVGLIVLTLE